MTWCVIIEWGDGTVAVNGPYDTESAAKAALAPIVHEIAEEGQPLQIHEGHVVIGSDWDDQIDVYTQRMGAPISAAVSR